MSTPSPLKLAVKLAKIQKHDILTKMRGKDEVSRMSYAGAMGMALGTDGQ